MNALALPRFWRSAAYLLTTVPVIGFAGPVFALLGLPWLYLFAHRDHDPPSLTTTALLVVLGAVLIGGLGPLVAVPLGALERLRLRITGDRSRGVGPAWWRVRYTAESTWRSLAYAILLVTVGAAALGLLASVLLSFVALATAPWLAGHGPIVFGTLTIDNPVSARWAAVAGVVLLFSTPWLLMFTARGLAGLARVLLREPAGADLVEVSRSRARLAGSFEAERRRIERDLHDGAQQRLVSLTLQLGLARLDVPADSPAAATVGAAHDSAKQLMDDLRELIRGIYPQVLSDSGLSAAVRELAERAPLPVTVDADLPSRPAAGVEVAAYFLVAEALTNVVRHSAATGAAVSVRRTGGLLVAEVVDDGIGGADPSRGTGLTGLADRAAAAGGRMLLSSPPGGPTRLRVELPCG